MRCKHSVNDKGCGPPISGLASDIYGEADGLLDNSASTYRGQVFVKTRYLMLSNAASKISSVNSLGTRLLVLAVLEAVPVESILVGRSRTSSQGHTTFSLPFGDCGAVPGIFGIYGSNSTSAKVL